MVTWLARLTAAREVPLARTRAADSSVLFTKNHCDTQPWARPAHFKFNLFKFFFSWLIFFGFGLLFACYRVSTNKRISLTAGLSSTRPSTLHHVLRQRWQYSSVEQLHWSLINYTFSLKRHYILQDKIDDGLNNIFTKISNFPVHK